MSARFTLNTGWSLLLKDLGLSVADVLRLARLPADLPSHQNLTLSTAEYFALWNAMETLYQGPTFSLDIATAFSKEVFSPPLFACFCSENLATAVTRLSQYKALVGPMTLRVDGATISLAGLPNDLPPPPSVELFEQVFLTEMARIATRERIVPKAISVTEKPATPEAYEAFFGTPLTLAKSSRITFRPEDMHRPFLSAKPDMWAIFEPDLRARLSEITQTTAYRDRVQTVLTEGLAGGQHSMESTARKLGVSARTLQRRLAAEGTSFQAELSALREKLARHYLRNTRLSTAEIAFLIGYAEPNSFFRAFQEWTGTTPDRLRNAG